MINTDLRTAVQAKLRTQAFQRLQVNEILFRRCIGATFPSPSVYLSALNEACVSSHGRGTCVMEDVVGKVRVDIISNRSYDGSGCDQNSSG